MTTKSYNTVLKTNVNILFYVTQHYIPCIQGLFEKDHSSSTTPSRFRPPTEGEELYRATTVILTLWVIESYYHHKSR